MIAFVKRAGFKQLSEKWFKSFANKYFEKDIMRFLILLQHEETATSGNDLYFIASTKYGWDRRKTQFMIGLCEKLGYIAKHD